MNPLDGSQTNKPKIKHLGGEYIIVLQRVHTSDAIERRCAVSRVTYPKAVMIRFCVSPDGYVTPDIHEKLPGRGIWVHCTRVAKAIKTDTFAYSAKSSVLIPDSLMDIVEKVLYNRLCDTIHGAKRAGVGISGFETVRDALKNNALAIVFSCANGTADGHKKLQGMCRMLDVMFCNVLDAQTTHHIWQRDNATYAGIKKCAMAHTIQREILRYDLFQNGDDT